MSVYGSSDWFHYMLLGPVYTYLICFTGSQQRARYLLQWSVKLEVMFREAVRLY